MKKKDLLSHIHHLVSLLNDPALEAVNSQKAAEITNSMNSFKLELAGMIDQLGISQETDATNEGNDTKPFPDDEIIETAQWVTQQNEEIRTVLNDVIGFTDGLKEQQNMSVGQLEHVHSIATASYSLMDSINELLEFSKLAEGTAQFTSVHFNLYALVKEITFLCNTLILREKLSLEVTLDNDVPELLIGDPARLGQVLLNLLGNTIKNIETGEIHLSIALNKHVDSEVCFAFALSDAKVIGGNQETTAIPNIFIRNDDRGESALNFAIVRQLVLRQGGEINLSGRPDQNAAFWFSLPYRIGDESQLSVKKQDREYLREGAKLIAGYRILVFEDNPLNQRLIKLRLKKWGCISYITDDYYDGLRFLENHRIDVVLTDLRMPKMSGFEVARRIREHRVPEIQNIPIMALTGDFSVQDQEKCQQNGIDDYVLKPYSPDELLLKLIKNNNRMKKEKALEENTLNVLPTNTDNNFNLQKIFEDCMEDFDLLEELIRLYKQNAIEFIGAARIHLEQENFQELAFVLHKIKSGLAMMQTDGLHTIVSEMHTSCKTEQDLKHMNFLYECFLEEYPKVEERIDASLIQLKKNRIH